MKFSFVKHRAIRLQRYFTLLLMSLPAWVSLWVSLAGYRSQNYTLLTSGLIILLVYFPLVVFWKAQKQAQLKLQQLNLDSRTLLDNAYDMILQHDFEGHIFGANKPAAKMLGYSLRELQSLSLWDLDEKRVLKTKQGAKASLLQGDAIKYEADFCARNGQLIPVEVRTQVTDWHDSNRLISIVRDVSEWRDTEQALEASRKALERARNRLETRVHQRARELKRQIHVRKRAEKDVNKMREFLHSMFDSMPSIIIALDMQQRVTQWNQQAELMTGISADQALEKSLSSLVPEFQTQIEKYTDPQHIDLFPSTERIEGNVGGKHRLLDIMVYPLRSEGSIGVVVRVDDVTEKARIEDLLVQTEKMMSLGGLAAGMAHEINNPLGAVLQSSQNLRRRLGMELSRNHKIAESLGIKETAFTAYIEKQKIMTLLDTIDEGGKRAATIVEDMLSFARPGGLENQAVDVVEVMNAAIRLAQRDYSVKKQYDFRRITIARNYQQKMPSVGGRKNRLQQVFLNLLTNAAQALFSNAVKAPQISIKVYTLNKEVVIDVIDNGPGMPESVSRRIFEPFYSTKAEGSGTGLGLSVSYFIISEQMRGSMEVKSQPGQGTKFIIRLPFTGDEAKDEEKDHAVVTQRQFDLPL